MDNFSAHKLNAYLEAKVWEVLNSPNFVQLPVKQKTESAPIIRERLNDLVFAVFLNNLNTEQLRILKNLPMESEEFAQKVQEFSKEIPTLKNSLEEELAKEVESIKANPQSLSQ